MSNVDPGADQQPPPDYDPELTRQLREPARPSFDPRAPSVWDPSQQQQTQTPPGPGEETAQQPQRVAADQSVQAGAFTTGTPSPRQPLLPPAIGPWGPYGMPAFNRADRQTYIPAAADRAPQDWGQDAQFPMMPQSWEVPGIYRGVGAQLAQWGPGSIAPYAAMMGQYGGAWMKGYMRGQEFLARQNHERMTWAAQETERRMGEMLREYGAIHAIYGDDPANADKLHQALSNAAFKYQDEHMKAALGQVGPDAARRLLDYYDGKFRDTAAANRARQKDEAIKEAEAPYRKSPVSPSGLPRTDEPVPETEQEPAAPSPAPPPAAPGADEEKAPEKPAEPETPDTAPEPPEPNAPERPPVDWGTGGETSGPGAPRTQGEAPEAGPDQEAAAAEPEGKSLRGLYAQASPEQVAAVTGQQPAAAPAAGAPPQARKPPPPSTPALQGADGAGYDPEAINQVAEDMLTGKYKPAQYKNAPGVSAWATRRYLEMKGELDRIQNSNLQGKAVIDAVRKVSPSLAGDMEALLDGTAAPPRSANFARPPLDRLFGLMHKADPTLTPDLLQTRAATRRSYASGADGRNVTSVTTTYRHINEGLDALKTIPGGWRTAFSQMKITSDIAKAFGSPEEQERANRALEDIRTKIGTSLIEARRAITGRPVGVTEEKAIRDELKTIGLPQGKPIESLEQELLSLKPLLADRLDELRRRYQAGTGMNARAMDEIFKPIDRGTMADLDRQPRSQTQSPAQSNDAARKWLEKNPNDPDAPAVRRKLGIQ